MTGNATLTESQASQIKTDLWNGYHPHDIAKKFKVGIGTIYNVRSGWRWEMVPWPNGMIGAMPKNRKKEIARAGKIAKRLYTREVLAQQESK